MVLMMESKCVYFMYFPAVPIPDLSDPTKYRTLPRRSHLYLGETVHFLLVLRSRDGAAATKAGSGASSGGETENSGQAWRELVGSLSAVASVCPGGESRQRSQFQQDFQSSCSDDGAAEEEADEGDFAADSSAGRRGTGNRRFRLCKPLLIHNSATSDGRHNRRAPAQVVNEWKTWL